LDITAQFTTPPPLQAALPVEKEFLASISQEAGCPQSWSECCGEGKMPCPARNPTSVV